MAALALTCMASWGFQVSPAYLYPPHWVAPSSSFHCPYPTGSLWGAAGQANGAVDGGQLFPKALHFPLGSFCSLGRKRG